MPDFETIITSAITTTILSGVFAILVGLLNRFKDRIDKRASIAKAESDEASAAKTITDAADYWMKRYQSDLQLANEKIRVLESRLDVMECREREKDRVMSEWARGIEILVSQLREARIPPRWVPNPPPSSL